MFPNLVSSKSAEKQHVVIALDNSGSMNGIRRDAEKHFNLVLEEIKRSAKETGIATRMSLITFGAEVKERFASVDVENVQPFPAGTYRPNEGSTRLLDGARRAFNTLTLSPGESGLVYVITDGWENASIDRRTYFVDDANRNDRVTLTFAGPSGAKRYFNGIGVPEGNIVEWEQSGEGVETLSATTVPAVRNYYTVRSTGVKSTKNFFDLDLRNLNPKKVRRQLTNVRTSAKVWTVPKEAEIQEFVTEKLGYYRPGSAYYEITKKEDIQEGKELLLMRKGGTGVFRGKDITEVKKILGMPVTGTSRVDPLDLERWKVFVQSTSNNRKLVRGTKLVVL